MTGKDIEAALVTVASVQGDITAQVIKSHLESEGIPVLLKYESAGRVYGVMVNGIGMVRIMVPRELASQAKEIIQPRGD